MKPALEELERFDPEGTYRKAATDYLDATRKYWEFAPVRTIEQLQLPPGSRLVDFGCGPGHAANYAAQEIVGPNGYVEGMDVADEMLNLARADAAAAGLVNVGFRQADFDNLPSGDESFDAVTCCSALFFAKHIDVTLRRMLTYLRPGGTLAVTTLTAETLEPAKSYFLSNCRAESPGTSIYIPWTRLTDADVLNTLLAGTGLVNVEVRTEIATMALPRPKDWWNIVLGSGLRRMVMDMKPNARSRVQSACERWLTEHNVTTLTCGFNYAIAQKGDSEVKTSRS